MAAPTANGARKNETVAISPTASSTAAMTHRTHASICGNGTSHPTVCTVGRSAGPSSAQQRAREVAGVEGPQVVELLSDADELHRDPELARDRERDAALRGAVELREDDPVHRDDLREELRLAQPVLAGRRVDGEERLVRRAVELLADDTADLPELGHQRVLRVQA